MNAFLDQLGLNSTFFIELGIFAVLFPLLGHVYFRPFLKLFELRHKRTVEDKEAAERILAQAQMKLDEYKRILSEERMAAKKHFDAVLLEASKQESEILAQAREQSKKVTQEAVEAIQHQKSVLKKSLESEVESIAQTISEKLLSRKV